MNRQYAPQLGPKDAHNTYMRLAVETGLPGLALWVILFWSVLRDAHRERYRADQGPLATQQLWLERATIGFLVAGFFGSYDALNFPYLMLAVLSCSASLLRDRTRQSAT
jgi:O-antigen ligase